VYGVLLVAVDQSEQSDRAVEMARDLARRSGGSVKLLHVREHTVVVGRGPGVQETEGPEEVGELLEKEVGVLKDAGVPVTTEIRRAVAGAAAREIVDAAKTASADLIVMGSRGRSELTAVLLGSNAYKVVHLSDRPVLVVH
jgi:nucleotide-binding universal stress UspA family protein